MTKCKTTSNFGDKCKKIIVIEVQNSNYIVLKIKKKT